jgi:glycosyltransferase involved in cell wall biosynthesis
MENANKIHLVIFGELSSNPASGRSFFNYKIAQYFNEKNALDGIFCIGFEKKVKQEFKKIWSVYDNFFLKLFFKYNRYVLKFFRGINIRRVKEKLFDNYFSNRIKYVSADKILLTKPVTPAIVRKAKAENKTVLTFATIAHPEFNEKNVSRIENDYSLKTFSSYTDNERVKRLSETFRESNEIILTVDSKFLKDSYKDYGINENKITTLNSDVSVNTEFFKPIEITKPAQITFLTIGMGIIKGIPLLLDAWEKFKSDTSSNAKLILAGPVVDKILPVFEKYDPGKLNYELAGHVSRNNIVQVYNSAHIFIAPSISDLGPETILEAMACGLPVISSLNCGNSKYIIENENGFTYEPFDIESLTELLKWFNSNPHKIQLMGKKARSSVSDKSVGNFIEDLYKYILENKTVKVV